MLRLTSNRPWLIKVPILPGEIFSSWLVRVAFAYGMDPLDLTYLLWGKWRVWTTDLDRSMDDCKLAVIKNANIVKCDSLYESFLYPVASQVAAINNQAVWPWILAVGSRNRKRYGGMQFCPKCLYEDDESYFRLKWRFAWRTCCAVHNLALIDKCPKCFAAIEYHRNEFDEPYLYLCGNCKFDLRKSLQKDALRECLDIQRCCENAIMNGHSKFGDVLLSTPQWFSVLKFFGLLLKCCTNVKFKGLRKLVSEVGIDVSQIHPHSTGLPVEITSVHERQSILTQSFKMMSISPTLFKRQIQKQSMRINSLLNVMNPLPDIINDMFIHDKTTYRKSMSTKEMYLPKSRSTVLKHYERLKRKVRKNG